MDLFSDIYKDTISESTVIVRKDRSNLSFMKLRIFSCGSIHGFFVFQISINVPIEN